MKPGRLTNAVGTLKTGVAAGAKQGVRFAAAVGYKAPVKAARAVKKRAAEAVEITRDAVSKTWIFAIFVTVVVIHLGRMGIELTPWGLLAPFVTTAADLVAAFVLGLLILIAARIFLVVFFPWLESSIAARVSGKQAAGLQLSPFDRLGKGFVSVARGRRNALINIGFASWGDLVSTKSRRGIFARAIQLGLLPVLAMVAISPALGFTWYFNSENWMAGLQHLRAEVRTDAWRERYVQAAEAYRSAHPDTVKDIHGVEPPGLEENRFSFVVIGDTGEGDASQLALHDQLLKVTESPDVKFVLVSSDVIYPSGEMKDYESKFYLPFKGVTKPIYALPGNHDWYGELEAFIANFYEPDLARGIFQQTGGGWFEAFMNLVTTARVDRLGDYVRKAQSLRSEYRLETGRQRNMYFRMANDYFLLLVVDTGCRKRVDPEQFEWMRRELEEAGNRAKMVILGHPLFVHGKYDGSSNENFDAVYQLLKHYRVDVAMAGDVHDFEYYAVSYAYDGGAKTMHHFVNGGGGAYLNLETALSWPDKRTPDILDFAFYPPTGPLRAKLDVETPWWKGPILWWTADEGAYPFSPSTTSSAFDFNAAPFFQSFVKVSVERTDSVTTIEITPYGANGILGWGQLARSGQGVPTSAADLSQGMVRFKIRK